MPFIGVGQLPRGDVQAKIWLESATTKDLREFSDLGGEFWMGTVGCNDLLYLPFGCIKAERASSSVDPIGLRMGFMPKTDHHAVVSLQAFMTELAVIGKKNVAMSAMIKIYETSSGECKAAVAAAHTRQTELNFEADKVTVAALTTKTAERVTRAEVMKTTLENDKQAKAVERIAEQAEFDKLSQQDDQYADQQSLLALAIAAEDTATEACKKFEVKHNEIENQAKEAKRLQDRIDQQFAE